jgi:hypothetical protein
MVEEAEIERVLWPTIAMAGSHLLAETGVRRSLLESFCANDVLTPDVYGTDARAMRPFEFEEAAAAATGPYPNVTFHLRRRKVIRYEALVFQSKRAGIDVEFHSSTKPARWPDVFEVGDRLARATTPDFGTTHLLSCVDDLFPTTDPDVKTRRMMDAGTDVAPAAYFAGGAGGLGLRTYLGPLVLDSGPAGARSTRA